VSVLIASAISVPPGLLVGHTARGGVVLVGLANAMRALPTLGLLTLLFLLLRSQRASALVSLVVLAVPPVLAGSTDPAGPVTLEALRSGQAQVVNLFTTSPDIAANRQVELADPKHMYPAQRILPLVRVGALNRLASTP
jgi:ABC-type nitrate/sulfonate/bicarbonate transport system permease component